MTMTNKDARNASSPVHQNFTPRNFHIPFYMAGQDDASTARAIGRLVARMLSRWPFPLSQASHGLWSRFVMTASFLQQPDLGPLLHFPVSRIVRKDEVEYKIRIPFIDIRSGKGTGEYIPVRAMTLLGATIPEVPEPVRYYKDDGNSQHTAIVDKIEVPGKSSVWSSSVKLKDLPNHENPADHQKADKFCKFLSWKLSGLCTDKESIVNLADIHKRTVGARTKCLSLKSIYHFL